MDARQRRELARYGAPAAFLAAVTIAVLLIKAGLSDHSRPATTGHALPTRPATVRPATSTRPSAARYYTIQPGDTLGAIALREKTTVAELLRLNPATDPQTLHAGTRIRVH